jgi:NADH-quinone oxidoreductase subunit M
VFALASKGLPGLGNFVAEFLVLFGTWSVSPVAAAFASLALILSTVYALWMVQAAFQGRVGAAIEGMTAVRDLDLREMAVAGALVAAIVWLGVYPQPFVDTAAASVEHVRAAAGISGELP